MKQLLTLLLLFTFYQLAAQTVLPGMPNVQGQVYAIEKVGNTMYIGGFFTQVNGQPRAGLARFNATTGALDGWAPTGITNGVTSLTRVANKLIAGGAFQTVNGQPRLGICMFDLATGNLEPWSDVANFVSWRQGVGVYGNNFYYSPLSPSRIVAVDATTGTSTTWQSSPAFAEQGDINAIYVSGAHVYVGGSFRFASGPSVYDHLCRFDMVTGALDSTWHPQPNVGDFGVNSIVRTNDHIFIGGDFSSISGQTRKGVAAYNLDGTLAAFNQNSSSSEVLSLYPDGDHIWVGGNSNLLGGQSRFRIAQIQISNSAASCWNASATSSTWSTVQAIHVAGDTVYAGPFGSPNLTVFVGSPAPQTPVAISGPASVAPAAAATYTVPQVAGCTYTWTVTGGTGTSTTNSINVVWGLGPIGSVSVVVNTAGITNCSSNSVTLGVAISGTTTIDENMESTDSFFLFPNPTSGLVSLHRPHSAIGGNAEVRVLDALGNVVVSSVMKDDVIQLDLTFLPNGFYCVLIGTDGGTLTKKLMKN